jgi:dolichol-phosphate mannosyltransferase
MRALTPPQVAAAGFAVARLARGRHRRPALGELPPIGDMTTPSVSVVIPARNEERRLGPCLTAILADPEVDEVLVVDDGSSDGTAALAERLGARVVSAGLPPPGWVGKPWALQRGLEEANGDVVVSLDADTRPRPGLARGMLAALANADFVTVGARFRCDSLGEQLLHPALLATLIVRYGPPDASAPQNPERLLANGQCTAVRRRLLLDAGGYAPAARHMTDDAAQLRALARAGWRVAFHDGGDLITVDMHDSVIELWREWGRSIALADVTPPGVRMLDAATVWLVLALPWVRLLARRAGWLDRLLIAARVAIAVALAPAYAPRRAAYWLSPLADPAAALRLALSAVRQPRRWRGRRYAAAGAR